MIGIIRLIGTLKSAVLLLIIEFCVLSAFQSMMVSFAFPTDRLRDTISVRKFYRKKTVIEILRKVEGRMRIYDNQYGDYPESVRKCTLMGCRGSISKILKKESKLSSKRLVRIVHDNIIRCEKQYFKQSNKVIQQRSVPTSSKWMYGPSSLTIIEDCRSGHHWCCIFVGARRDLPCFEIYCWPYGEYCI